MPDPLIELRTKELIWPLKFLPNHDWPNRLPKPYFYFYPFIIFFFHTKLESLIDIKEWCTLWKSLIKLKIRRERIGVSNFSFRNDGTISFSSSLFLLFYMRGSQALLYCFEKTVFALQIFWRSHREVPQWLKQDKWPLTAF